MKTATINEKLTISDQIQLSDLQGLVSAGVKTLICNRPDGEDPDQPTFTEISAQAETLGLRAIHQPIVPGQMTGSDIDAFRSEVDAASGKVHAYCRTGTRSITLWSMSEAQRGLDAQSLIDQAETHGYDLSGLAEKLCKACPTPPKSADAKQFDIVIVGGGAGGISVASSLLKRAGDLSICIVDPAEVHYYQPGWTMVGAGVFSQEQTVRSMASLIPDTVTWIKEAVASFQPRTNQVTLEDGSCLAYQQLVVAPGLKLNWRAIEGLSETLGQNGVTSNYRYDLAPYTWKLVQGLKSGKALFTQPPMPIKCAGAPQKALYLSSDHWLKQGALKNIDVEFCNAGPVLFGVQDYVPALMEYVKKYDATLSFGHNLVKIDGPAKTAWFEVKDADGNSTLVEKHFDMIHVCPPQCAPDFVRNSELADAAGWLDVDQTTLQHKRFENVWSLGDVQNAPNAKTAAAARMQAPIVANNLLHALGKEAWVAHYNGYGSCPLTVERGKIVLAEFGYGGKLLPSFPSWVLDGRRPTRSAWWLKEIILPPIYWKAMLKGREWMVTPVPASKN